MSWRLWRTLVAAVGAFQLIIKYILTFHCAENKNDPRADKEGFRGLWRRLKPADKPDEVHFIGRHL